MKAIDHGTSFKVSRVRRKDSGYLKAQWTTYCALAVGIYT